MGKYADDCGGFGRRAKPSVGALGLPRWYSAQLKNEKVGSWLNDLLALFHCRAVHRTPMEKVGTPGLRASGGATTGAEASGPKSNCASTSGGISRPRPRPRPAEGFGLAPYGAGGTTDTYGAGGWTTSYGAGATAGGGPAGVHVAISGGGNDTLSSKSSANWRLEMANVSGCQGENTLRSKDNDNVSL